jgi:hypothetical protein
MDKSWNAIKKEASITGCLILDKYKDAIHMSLGADNVICVIYRPGKYYIDDIFTGESYGASHEDVMEFIQKIRLLPTPTYPGNVAAGVAGYEQRCQRSGEYCQVNIWGMWTNAYVCEEYIIIKSDWTYRVILPGESITMYGVTFSYSIEAFVAALRHYE